MTIFAFLLLALGVGIFVALKSKKLTVTELVVCGSFGLLLGATAAGRAINRFLLSTTEAVVPTVSGWLS
jgi:hydrogenase/urease accessory protein HupE